MESIERPHAEPAIKRRTREAAAVRRARILEAAIGLIGERGYYGFTIQELGKRCGLSNPGLLHYFPSKQDVLIGVLQELEARETAFMTPLAQLALHAEQEDSSPELALHILVTMAERATASPKLARVIVALHAEALDPEHPAHGWWREREAMTLGFLSQLLHRHVPQPDMAAKLVLSCMDGLLLQWLSVRDGRQIVPDWKQALARLLPELHG